MSDYSENVSDATVDGGIDERKMHIYMGNDNKFTKRMSSISTLYHCSVCIENGNGKTILKPRSHINSK